VALGAGEGAQVHAEVGRAAGDDERAADRLLGQRETQQHGAAGVEAERAEVEDRRRGRHPAAMCRRNGCSQPNRSHARSSAA
jgi:hypothetical protein